MANLGDLVVRIRFRVADREVAWWRIRLFSKLALWLGVPLEWETDK